MMWKKGLLRSFLLACLPILSIHFVMSEKADDVRKRSFELISQGITLYKKGDYQQATDKLGEASRMALNSFLAYYYYGLSLSALRRYSEAIEPLRIALDLNPKNIQAHLALGDTYLHIGDYEEALAEYYRIFEINKAYAPAYDGIGRYYESIGHPEEAIKNFQKAIELNRGFAEAYLHLGDLYLRSEDFGKAIELFKEALEIRPHFPEALNRLGIAYAKIQLYNRAVTTIKKAIALKPKESFHYLALGEIFLELNHLQQALTLLKKAIDLDPLLIEAYIALAKAYRQQDEYVTSLSILEEIKTKRRLNNKVLENIEKLQKRFHSEKRSLEQIWGKINGGTASQEELEKLSDLYASKGNFHQASLILEQCPHWQQNSSLMKKMAYYLLKSNKFKEANDIWNKIVLMREADVGSLVNMGICYSELGNEERAIQSFLKALAMEPGHMMALLYLANSYLRMGNLDEAEKRYSLFLEKGGKGPKAEKVKKILTILKKRVSS